MEHSYPLVCLAMLAGTALYFGIGGLIADRIEAKARTNRGMATRIR